MMLSLCIEEHDVSAVSFSVCISLQMSGFCGHQVSPCCLLVFLIVLSPHLSRTQESPAEQRSQKLGCFAEGKAHT